MKRIVAILLIFAPLYGGAGGDQKKFNIRAVSVFAGAAWSRYSQMPGVATIPEIHGTLGSRTGAVVGFSWEVYLNDHIMLDNGLIYIRKGTTVNWYYFDEPMGRWAYALDVLSFPVTFRFKPFVESSPYVLAGYELSIIGGHRLTESMDPEGSFTTKLTDYTRQIDLGFCVGAGAELAIKKLTPFAELRYNIGLLNLSKGTGPLESYPTIKARALVLLAGIRFRIK
jgi:hypothetical protein